MDDLRRCLGRLLGRRGAGAAGAALGRDEMAALAAALMREGFTCAQAVVTAGQRRLGRENPGLVRAMAFFGGGVLATGGPCGALLGGVALLGELGGRARPGDKDDRAVRRAALEYHRRFREEVVPGCPSVQCRDITGVSDWADRAQVKAYRRGGGRERCYELTGRAAGILWDILEGLA
ncbi:C_GCAxxG_C_C family protein [Dissulfurirhabdus thermomarina]|uniref:C_GCAxxG_C_C family protein n=1 Tax=Dissulfurirhabdus thermomarina TaxID=1765737 RepID=A0A6N9TRC9_DISTH|nr:C-GCAxxG-C-C family protein [Dissulfurirhabdus thermomarina]NDY42990.1 C_GCAxxG_C_C family protein [Dissulfurirhabdus thermomarina]NMX22718.1 C_GCAxxG_C_C family protein [Dissulfurirhabdus thermomarina]